MFYIYAPHPATIEVITLVNPELDDAVALLGDVSIKRTMNGLRRTYVKNKGRKSFKYNFSLTEAKATELLTFCRNYVEDQVKILYNSDTIIGYFTSNPVEVIKTGHGYTGVILTFEGDYA